jgi:hypothetical protein
MADIDTVDTFCYPIIYVRGYAMTQSEIEDTTADPFCGFNKGSVAYRATADRNKIDKYMFESPLLRLITDFGYQDVYHQGLDIVDNEWKDLLPRKSIFIYRYYDECSNLLGTGAKPSMKEFATGLSDLILKIREWVCKDKHDGWDEKDFKCYLVAHSMGGLVCRAFLQNSNFGKDEARDCVDKVFTYATPHNGIDMLGMNVSKHVPFFDADTFFNRDNMAAYLDLQNVYNTMKDPKRVDWMPENIFPSERFFCMIGTNRMDYNESIWLKLSRSFVGDGSDGLVKIANASVWGIGDDNKVSAPCPTAYTYRSHSGVYGIVNSEEAYQNLIRFLFGDLKVDVWVDIESIRLPNPIKDKNINALYQFETRFAPMGMRWALSRRISEEDSVACRTHEELTNPSPDPNKPDPKMVYLSTAFLGSRWKQDKTDRTLNYSLYLGICTDEYKVDGVLFNHHFEGDYLFRKDVKIAVTPPDNENEPWDIKYKWGTDGNYVSVDRIIETDGKVTIERQRLVPENPERGVVINGRDRGFPMVGASGFEPETNGLKGR